MNGRLADVYRELYEQGVSVFDEPASFSCGAKAAVIEADGAYGIFVDASRLCDTAEEACVIAHEAGHIMTGSTHRLSSPFELIGRHEYRAEKWAIKKLVPKDELDMALKRGCMELWEMAEHFNVTPQFMERAINYYRRVG